MESMSISHQVNLSRCFQCQGDTEYYCLTCFNNLCPPCKRSHVISLDTKHHDVMLYREKFNSISKSETCVIHSDQAYKMYCKSCAIPVCFPCKEHRQHKLQNVRVAYKNQRKHIKDIVINIRSETHYTASVLQTVMKNDVTTCQREMANLQSAMFTKSQVLKDSMKSASSEISVKYKYLLIEKLGKQMIKLRRYITRIQIYEQRFQQLAYRPVNFLRFIIKVRLPRIQDSPHLSQHCLLSLTPEINIEDLIKIQSKIQIKEGEKRKLQARNELLLTLMPSPVLQKSTRVKGVNNYIHISCVTPDRVWVTDYIGNLILADTTTGDKLYHVEDPSDSCFGIHTVNSECELIYIDERCNIKIISNDGKTTTTFIRYTDSPWEPQCVFCSPSTGDLLVLMYNYRTRTGQVWRYNNTGKLTHRPNNTSHTLYVWPWFITENNNGDVVVSDVDDVVVTERGGRHRFSYSGPPSGPGLNPSGICTDALSHILVCDENTNSVQMISKDGEFLLYLLTRESSGINYRPQSLSYDVKTHLLWVTFWDDNKLSVCRHINRHLDLTDGVEL